MARTIKRKNNRDGQNGITWRIYIHIYLGVTQVSVRLAHVQDSFASSTRPIDAASQILRFLVRYHFSQSRCPSLLLVAMYSRVYFLFPQRGHEPPPTLRDRLNPHFCLRRRFLIPHYTKHTEVALSAIGLLFLLPTPSSPHWTLKVSEHDSVWQPPASHSDEHPRPQKKPPRAQCCLNDMTPGYLEGMVRLYEAIRLSLVLRCVPMMRGKTRSCTVRSLS